MCCSEEPLNYVLFFNRAILVVSLFCHDSIFKQKIKADRISYFVLKSHFMQLTRVYFLVETRLIRYVNNLVLWHSDLSRVRI